MKKAIFIFVLFLAVSGCKKVCYDCTTVSGDSKGEKCFNSKEDMYIYMEAQQGKSTEDICQ